MAYADEPGCVAEPGQAWPGSTDANAFVWFASPRGPG